MAREQVHISNIRALLAEAFTGEDLHGMSLDLPEFRPVYEELPVDLSKAAMIERLIDHADREELFDVLLDWAREHNPDAYKAHQPYRVPGAATAEEQPASAARPPGLKVSPHILWLAVLVAALIALGYFVAFLPEPTFHPGPTGSLPEAGATPTPPPFLITENTTATGSDVLGQIEVEYPLRLRPLESANIFLKIYIPPELASTDPELFKRILIPPDESHTLRELNTHYSVTLVSPVMRVELSSQTFQIADIYPATQEVDLDAVDKPTIWGWNIVAPGTVGRHELTCKVYRDEDDVPSWVGSIEVEVAELTPTPSDTPIPTAAFTPTPTPTPVPFLQTPAGIAFIGAGGTIIAALIGGLFTFYVARESFPFIGTRARYRRTLNRLRNNLAYLEEQAAQYGMDVPLKIANEIEYTRAQIADTEARLAELEK